MLLTLHTFFNSVCVINKGVKCLWNIAQNVLMKASYFIWVRSRNCGCLVTWFCYQLIAKLGKKTATVSWPDPYTDWDQYVIGLQHLSWCIELNFIHLSWLQCLNSLRPRNTYLHQYTMPSLAQIMACHRSDACEPMLKYCWLDHWEQIPMKFLSKFIFFQSRKCIWNIRLQNVGPFVLPSNLQVPVIILIQCTLDILRSPFSNKLTKDIP